MDRKRVCKAFGSEERLKLLACLAKPQSVTELLDHCSLSQSALSQHLKVLRDAGAVTAKKQGREVFYQAGKKAAAIAKQLLAYH